jgi:hypothetical protein
MQLFGINVTTTLLEDMSMGKSGCFFLGQTLPDALQQPR